MSEKTGRTPIRRAIVSVSDKTGLVDFARALAERGIEIVSTGGTARALAEAGVTVRNVSDLTGFPEILDGRVKTLHPKLFGGILGRRDLPEHDRQMSEHAIEPIDLVVVNLYPFRETVARPDIAFEEAIEQIDIGGPSLLRAAAKNFESVAVVVDPADYGRVAETLGDGGTTRDLRLELARKVFAHTATYDGAISGWLEAQAAEGGFPARLAPAFELVQTLRYGENPHQTAAFYREASCPAAFAAFRQIQGKELSYNNLLDADAAWELVRNLPSPGAVVLKHGNPCGAATGATAIAAIEGAWAGDPISAFGSIVTLNVPVDAEVARFVTAHFVEVVAASSFSVEALEIFASKTKLRVLEVPEGSSPSWTLRGLDGGLLVQTRDRLDADDPKSWTPATSRTPSDDELADLDLAWRVATSVKSNAIVVARHGRILGIGAGQMSRLDSCRLALEKARDADSDPNGAVAASDAFFPFPDGVEVLAEGGVRAIVQPGGSIRDQEIREAAERLGLAMLLTGRRHFRH